MKRSSYSNRGMGLEKMIALFGSRYMASGEAYLIKHEPPVKHLKTLRAGQFVGGLATIGAIYVFFVIAFA